MGMTWEYPPPAAPPLMPNVGPWLGCLTQANTFFLSWEPIACTSPMVVVDFPSPRGVGVIPATHTYRPVFLEDNLSRVLRDTLAFFFPYRSTSEGRRPISEARRPTSLGV